METQKSRRFRYFDSDDKETIKSYLDSNNIEYWTPVLCNTCCGIFDDYFSLGGGSRNISDFLTHKQKGELRSMLKSPWKLKFEELEVGSYYRIEVQQD